MDKFFYEGPKNKYLEFAGQMSSMAMTFSVVSETATQ